MKNTKKDRKEKKYFKFLVDLSNIPFSDDYDRLKNELYRKNGFTEDDWHKAVRLTMSKPERKFYFDGVGYKKDVLNRKDKCAKKLERDLRSGKQEHFDKVGEEELEDERRWILDVYDEDYDPEKDMTR